MHRPLFYAPLCWLRTIWYTLKTGVWMDGRFVKGHMFTEHPDPTPPNVEVLQCKLCGAIDIGWTWKGFENLRPNKEID